MRQNRSAGTGQADENDQIRDEVRDEMRDEMTNKVRGKMIEEVRGGWISELESKMKDEAREGKHEGFIFIVSQFG